jgi:hypothetical protein
MIAWHFRQSAGSWADPMIDGDGRNCAARGGVPILQVQPAAERLMRSLAVVRAGLAETAELGANSRFDLECPLLSLPGVFRTSIDEVPWEGAYLDTELAAGKLAREALPEKVCLHQ